MKSNLGEKSIRNLLNILSGDAPVPAGGSLAALACALSASLGVFLSRATARFAKEAELRQSLEALSLHLKELSQKNMGLMDTDVDAYQQVMQALRMPEGGQAEQNLRKERLMTAWRVAVEIPDAVMRHGLEILRCGRKLISKVTPAMHADIAAMAEIAYSGLKAGFWIVMANLEEIHDAEFASQHRERAEHVYGEGEKLYGDIQEILRKRYRV